jgi:hypothetical protein
VNAGLRLLLPGVGEYHGVSAFTTRDAAVHYGGPPEYDLYIGEIWGQAIGDLSDGRPGERAVRVAVCYWGELTLVRAGR